LLPSGKVLVVGGSTATGSLATAEVYDPVGNTWTPTAGPLAAERGIPQCSLLGSGKVLVTGGVNAANTASTAVVELYDPDTDTFTPTGSLATARYLHTATVLTSGKVLVAGGCLGGWPCTTATASSEVYDPALGEWTSAGSMPFTVVAHTATRLLSGKVLIAGGCLAYSGVGSCGNGASDRHASLYDPALGAAGTWSATGNLAHGHSDHASLLLGSGDVLVVGGSYFSGSGTSTERYDPDIGTWALDTPTLNNHGSGPGAVKLPDGTWMVVGGVVPPAPGVYTGLSEIFAE
jgi:N-acetylneuraminic acid mutarotase